ncbi:MAG TPA: MFS transporter [Caulobacteraceae bacterium]|jgi:MFS family permease
MTQEAPDRAARRSAVAMYTLLSVMFINILGFGIVVPLLPFYGASFHAQAWQIALVFSAYSMGSFIGEPFWGRLSDRIGRKPILISTVLANCACYGLLAFAPTIWLAVLIRFCGGMAAGNGSVVQGYIADVTPSEHLAGRMARLGAAYNIGFILGPFVGGVLAKPSAGTIGFHIPLLAASGLAFCSAIGIMLAVRESRDRRPSEAQALSRWAAMGVVARHPVIGPLVLLTFLVGFAFNGIESVFGLWAHARFAWQPSQVGICFGISGLVSSPTQFLLTGVLSRRFGEARMLAIGMVGTVIAMSLQPFGNGGWETYALMAMTALSASVAFPNAGALLSRAIGQGNQGQIMGLNNAASALSRVLGPQAASLVFALLTVNGPYFLGALIVAPAIWLAVAAGRASARAASA